MYINTYMYLYINVYIYIEIERYLHIFISKKNVYIYPDPPAILGRA